MFQVQVLTFTAHLQSVTSIVGKPLSICWQTAEPTEPEIQPWLLWQFMHTNNAWQWRHHHRRHQRKTQLQRDGWVSY